MLAAGCQRDEVATEETGEETFTLRCVPESMGGGMGRAVSGENTINDYAVLIFKKTGSGIPAENMLVKKAEVTGGSEQVIFSAAQSEGEHYLYVVANSMGKLAGLSENGSTEQDFLDLSVSVLSDQDGLPASPFGMSSSKIILPQLNFATFDAATGGTVSLRRNVAKFKVTFSVSPSVFVPKTVEYKSMCRSGHLAETSSEPGSNPSDYLPALKLQNKQWENPVYLYEQRTSARDGDWKKDGFYLLVSGTYQNSGAVSYYRIALPTPEGTFADVKRNVSYELDVTSIKNPGFTTYEEADSSPFLNSVASVIKPDMEGLENLQEIYTNGYYEMGLDASESRIYRSGNYTIPITNIVTKVLDSSVKNAELKLVYGTGKSDFKLEPVSDRPGMYSLSYIKDGKQENAWVDSEGYHTAILVFGTLRKEVKVISLGGLDRTMDYVYKFRASNGRVEVENWTSSDWCGLGPNRNYDSSRYFGEIMNSIDENIFVYARKGGISGEERKVNLIASDGIIQLILRKN